MLRISNYLLVLGSAMLLSTGNSVATEAAFTISGSAADCHNNTSFEALFSEDCRFENFRNFSRFGPVKTIPASTQPVALPETIQRIDFSHNYLGKELRLSEFLEVTSTTGFIVLRDGNILDERYYHGNRPSAANAGFSMTKSIISALVGAALDDGSIRSIDDPVTNYIPEFTSDTFKGVTVKQVLQMSSGVKFNEDYSDPTSDINKMGYLVQEMSYIDYINTLEREHEPGTVNVYASINTHILGIIVARATAKGLSEYLSEKIWEPMGMQYSAHWMVDKDGYELPMGGLAVSLRDWARFGLLYAMNGRWANRQLLPAEWISESTVPSEPHLQPGRNEMSSYEFGYQYQWWIPRQPDNDFMALGIWGQTLYVNRPKGIVIVKLSANPGSFDMDAEYEKVDYLQALSDTLASY